METYALFSDKTASQIDYDFQSVSSHEEVKPIEIIIFIDDEKVKESAIKGVWAARNYLKSKAIIINKQIIINQLKIKRKIKLIKNRYFIVIDFDNDELKKTMTGGSAGLAFSLKFAQEIFRKSMGVSLNFSVAATGEVDKHTSKARVKGIDAINEKADIALTILQTGDRFFYPQENEKDFDPLLKKRIEEKGIILSPVSTVKQAIDILFDQYRVATKFSIRYLVNWITGILLIGSIILLLKYFSVFSNAPCYEQVTDLLEYGKYNKAIKKIEKCLNNTKDDKQTDQLKKYLTQISSELYLTIEFDYFLNDSNSKPFTSDDSIKKLSELSLTAGDRYRFHVLSNKKCYLHLFQFDSENGVENLFPLSNFSMENHFIVPNKSYYIPGGNNVFTITAETPQGLLTIYFLASSWRMKDIEDAYNAFEKASSEEKKEYQDVLLNRIQQRSTTANKGFGGTYYKKMYFLKR